MARNFHIDYGAKGGPALMDGDTGLEVGAEQKLKKVSLNMNHGRTIKLKELHLLKKIIKVDRWS